MIEDSEGNMRGDTDLGHGFSFSFTSWQPNRELNPQYEGIPDVEKCGVLIFKDGEAVSSIYFDTPEVRRIPGTRHFWRLVSLDPLHVEPSLQMYDKAGKPSHHGFIRGGQWSYA